MSYFEMRLFKQMTKAATGHGFMQAPTKMSLGFLKLSIVVPKPTVICISPCMEEIL